MPKRKSALREGFTLVELLVAIGIIAILAGMGIRSYSSLMRRAKEAASQTNLTSINAALSMYKKDHGDFPPDGKVAPALGEYEVGKSILTNPYDGKSCANLYVKRTYDEEAEAFVIASPFLRAKETMVLLFGRGPQKLPLRDVTHNGTPVAPGETVTLTGGDRLDFGDGTTVKKGTGSGVEVTLIQSFELADGTPYGLVRVNDIGEVKVEVTPGWKFEVITPAATAGVEGTKFRVWVISATETEIGVTEGSVWAKERTGKGRVLIPAGKKLKVNEGEPPGPEEDES